MKIGLDKLKWRGRKYLGGLIHGLAIGSMVGVYISVRLDLETKAFLVFPIMMIAVLVFVCLGHVVLGSPKKNKKKEKIG
ncbi:MAG: hypothetical protein PF692_02110 [Kiritimatiellae bacterium]|jgi:uncharacterized membrane protein YfcA|nr:hypothetical protein [Kiritimatiellia bacterium]